MFSRTRSSRSCARPSTFDLAKGDFRSRSRSRHKKRKSLKSEMKSESSIPTLPDIRGTSQFRRNPASIHLPDKKTTSTNPRVGFHKGQGEGSRGGTRRWL